ncbi:MAG: hypothetical protein R3F34_00565 [Planctomycetota bacterium]
MLTCRTTREGSRSVLMGIGLGIPAVAMFLCVGLALWIFYRHPEMLGSHAPDGPPHTDLKVFLEFILEELPSGMRGAMFAGIFAAGLSASTARSTP